MFSSLSVWVMKGEHTFGLRDRMGGRNTKHIDHGHLGECKLALWEMYSGKSGLLGYRICLRNNMTERIEHKEERERESLREERDERV